MKKFEQYLDKWETELFEAWENLTTDERAKYSSFTAWAFNQYLNHSYD